MLKLSVAIFYSADWQDAMQGAKLKYAVGVDSSKKAYPTWPICHVDFAINLLRNYPPFADSLEPFFKESLFGFT